MEVKIFGIPTCKTVKKARTWLHDKGIEYEWVDMRLRPPDKEQLATWMDEFGFKPMRNTSVGAYRKLGAEKKKWKEAEWLDAFADDAMLLKRPIVLVDGAPRLVGFKEAAFEEVLGG